MGAKSRNKGASYEREVAVAMRAVWPEARRRGNAQADGARIEADVEGTPYHVECKRCAKPPSWAQRRRWFADIPVDGRTKLLIVRADRNPSLIHYRTAMGLVCQPLEDFLHAHRHDPPGQR